MTPQTALTLFAVLLVVMSIPSGLRARALAARGRRDRAAFEAARVVLSVGAAVAIVWTTWGRPA